MLVKGECAWESRDTLWHFLGVMENETQVQLPLIYSHVFSLDGTPIKECHVDGSPVPQEPANDDILEPVERRRLGNEGAALSRSTGLMLPSRVGTSMPTAHASGHLQPRSLLALGPRQRLLLIHGFLWISIRLVRGRSNGCVTTT
ncbi:hypothetical protein SAY87_025617 [Trapa incisa]|uniref:Uncharacterized protein n=1 Tax=Trapa incisa TaxID=236973 RepID=A0AAN7GR89_9MYRT|nr:hypothetical protein SAY87_025617 [Trapa incisa]